VAYAWYGAVLTDRASRWAVIALIVLAQLLGSDSCDQVKPTLRVKCPSLRLSTPPPALCTMNASRMMTSITMTTQKKNKTIPGMAYPATVLALATAASYPATRALFGARRSWTGRSRLPESVPTGR
jgi:hypothetical protein